MANISIIVFISILIQLAISANVEIVHYPTQSIMFKNTTDPLSSMELSKFINQCLGYTTQRPAHWNGFNGYKNIAKDIPKSVAIFHMPFSVHNIAGHSFSFKIDSDLKEQYLQMKDSMLLRHENLLTDYVDSFYSKKETSKSIESQLDSLERYLKKLQPRNEDSPALLWFEMFEDSKELTNPKKQELVEERFKKISNQLKYLFGNNLLIISVYDENQSFHERSIRQSDPPKKKANLAHEYDVNFHTSFVTIGFAALLFILAVFVIAVSMWNIDPGRDSIIYRLTAQKIKKDQ